MLEMLLKEIGNPMVVILIAAFLDTLIFTGYIFYGFALLMSASVLYVTGAVLLPELVIGAYLGTTLANAVNFALGRFGGQLPFVEKRLAGTAASKVHHYLGARGLFIAMACCRFITFLRPAYGLVFGALRVNLKRFVTYELILAACWVSFWTTVMVMGENITLTILEWFAAN